MNVERHIIKSEQEWHGWRQKDVTASVAGALLGVHEYTTPFSLWALKSGQIAEDPEESAPMRRGRLLEPVAVEMLREERPNWIIDRGKVYLRDPDVRLGCTPDVFASDPERGPGVVQIKSVESMIFRKKWMQDGEVTPPLWIAVQAIIEAHLTGSKWAAVAPLVIGHGVDLPIIDIPIHAGVIEKIEEEVRKFWKMVESGKPPHPDYARDGETIARLYAHEAPGKMVDLRGDNLLPGLLDARSILNAEIKDREQKRDAINTEIKAKLGDAEIGMIDGFKVTWKTQKRKEHVVPASEFRVLRVTDQRATKEAA